METRKQLEYEAKRRGVALVPAADGATRPGPAAVRSTGWLSKVMPHGADLMASLKAQLDEATYSAVLRNLKRGGGYVVDHSTNIAVGSPPLDQYELGRTETRDGWTVMRVRPKTSAMK
jgi:hypothetical protein